MHECPCCAHRLVRQIRHHEIEWFCPHCWTAMPLLLNIKRQANCSECMS